MKAHPRAVARCYISSLSGVGAARELPCKRSARFTFFYYYLFYIFFIRYASASPRLRHLLTFEDAVNYQNFAVSVALPGQHLASPVFRRGEGGVLF